MKIHVIRRMLVCLLAMHFSQAVMADEFSVETGKRPITVGIGVLHKDKPYKKYDSSEKTNAVPLVLYEGEHFFARGGTIGWDFLDSDAMDLALIGQFMGGGYDSSDSKFLAGMDDRDPSIGVGGHFIYRIGDVGFKLAAVTDVSDNSEGTQTSGEVFYSYRTGNWMFKPSASIIWQDEDYNDYYYGVKPLEAIPGIGRFAYSADSDINYQVGAMVVYQKKTSPWMYIAGVRYESLGDEIDDSPIIDDDSELSGMLGVGYTFR